MSLGVALKRAFVNGSELAACSIRILLLADVLADLLQFKSDGGDGVATSPEMLARKIPLFAAQPGNGDRALPFEEPNHGCDWVLRGNSDAHMYVVRHEVTLNNLALLLPGQGMVNLPQMTARLPEDRFAPPLGHEHNMVLAVPF